MTTATNLRIIDSDVWERFKKLAEKNHQSANSLINVLIERYVKAQEKKNASH